MEVTQLNFKEVLPLVKEALDKCLFVAIETEHTGLEGESASEFHALDTLEERYQRVRNSGDSFLINQFGLSTFEWCEEQEESNGAATGEEEKEKGRRGHFVSRTFNFYLFPAPIGRLDRRYQSQASSLHFLSINGFDFNKVISEGIPFLTIPQEQELRERLLQQQRLQSSLQTSNPDICAIAAQEGIVRLNAYDQHYLNYVLSRVEEWQQKSGSKEALRVGPCDAILRRHITRELYEKYDNVFVDTERLRGKPYLVITEVEGGIEERKKREDSQIERQLQEVEEAVGFRKIFEMLMECKKGIVGYNMLRDLAAAYNQFYKPLPENCDQFKTALHSLFPFLYDVRHITATHPELSVHYARGLIDTFTFLNNNHELQSKPKVIHAPGFERYSGDNENAEGSKWGYNSKYTYEAGLDAWMTGVAYLRVVYKVIEHRLSTTPFSSSPLPPLQAGEGAKENGPSKTLLRNRAATFPVSKYLKELTDNENVNRLYLANWESSFNLAALQEIPDFRNVFYVSGLNPAEKESMSHYLHILFAPYGRIQIKTLDATSAFVMVLDRSQVPYIDSKLIKPNKSSSVDSTTARRVPVTIEISGASSASDGEEGASQNVRALRRRLMKTVKVTSYDDYYANLNINKVIQKAQTEIQSSPITSETATITPTKDAHSNQASFETPSTKGTLMVLAATALVCLISLK